PPGYSRRFSAPTAAASSAGTGLWQRSQRGPSGSSSGVTVVHTSRLRVQRGAKAHADDHGSVSVGEPGIGCSADPYTESSRGIEPSSPVVYGCRGETN